MNDASQSKSGRLPLLPILMLLAFMAVLYVRSGQGGLDLGWGGDVSDAVATAEETSRPVLVAFHGGACPPCHAMERQVLSTSEVKGRLADFVPVMIDAFRDVETASRFDVYATPTYLILDAASKPCVSATGYLSTDEFLAFMNAGLKQCKGTRPAPIDKGGPEDSTGSIGDSD